MSNGTQIGLVWRLRMQSMKIYRPLLVLLLSTVASPTFADETVIRAGKVYTADGKILAPGAVHVKDGKIVVVAENVAPPANARILDLGEGVLIPGLVDAFTSIGMEGGTAEATVEITPNFRVYDAMDWSARAFRHARAEGVTTVNVVPGTDNVITGLSCIAKTAGERAQRVIAPDHALVLVLASDPAIGNNSRNRPDSIYNRQPTNRMGVVWMLRSEFGMAKRVAGKEKNVLREALAGTRPVICVSRSDSDMTAALRLREEYPMNLTLAGGQEAYKMRPALAVAKVPILLGPLTIQGSSGAEQTETVLNVAGLLDDAKIPFALTGGNLLDQARFAVRYGLPREAALAAITTTPARLLGLDKRLGSIAVDRDADLVAFSGDPFDVTSRVRWTMINGVVHAEE